MAVGTKQGHRLPKLFLLMSANPCLAPLRLERRKAENTKHMRIRRKPSFHMPALGLKNSQA